MDHIQTIIKKVKRQRVLAVVVFIALLIVSAIIPGDWAIMPGIFFSTILLFLLYLRAELMVENLLTKDCDPHTYLHVKKAVTKNIDSMRSILLTVDANASFLLGDFTVSLNATRQLIALTKKTAQEGAIAMLAYLGFCLRAPELIRESMAYISACPTPQKPAHIERRQRLEHQNAMLLAYTEKDFQKAAELADFWTQPPYAQNYHLLCYHFIRGEIYFDAGQKSKARTAFQAAGAISGKTFMTEACQQRLATLESETENANGAVHDMTLNATPFAMIAAGEKTYELRLFDEKRQTLSVGDTIRFTHRDNATLTLTVRVVGLHRFDSFEALYAALPLDKCGYRPEELATASPADMEAYYSPEMQARYGVLAIEVALT